MSPPKKNKKRRAVRRQGPPTVRSAPAAVEETPTRVDEPASDAVLSTTTAEEPPVEASVLEDQVDAALLEDQVDAALLEEQVDTTPAPDDLPEAEAAEADATDAEPPELTAPGTEPDDGEALDGEPADEASADELPEDELLVDEPLVDDLLVDEPAAEELPAGDPADETGTDTLEPASTQVRAVDDEPDESSAEGGNMPVSTRHAWRRLGRLIKPRISTGNILAALMTLAVGFALVAQVQNAQGGGLEDLSETELVALLDDVTERADSLEEEIRLLEADRRALEQGSGVEAAEAAQARLASNQILAGSVPVTGPGITMSVSAPDGGFTPTMMIDVMQELRNAGAEAIQFGTVRVVANTWIGIEDGQLTVDGQVVEAPFRILAIGDPHTLSGAMAIPGGFTDSVRGIGGDVQIVEGDSLLIDSLKITGEPHYARPVPSE